VKIWAIANQKGGVGKTTTAVNLAGHLVKQGLRVLLVDMDPHGSMSAYFGLDPDSQEKSVYQLFQGNGTNPGTAAAEILYDPGIDGLQLLPSSTALATLDRQLGTQEGKGLVMVNAMTQLEQEFDYALLDCPPLLGILMVNALAACGHLLLPVQTEFLAIKGLERMMRTLKMIRRARRNTFEYTIVPTMFDRRTRAALDSLRTLREQYGSELWESVIPIDTKFREASKQGLPLSIMAPSSRGSKAYEALLTSLLTGRDKAYLKRASS